MLSLKIINLLFSCSINPLVHPATLNALVQTESDFNQFAIAIVNGKSLKKQPKTFAEAKLIIQQLERKNINYSVGLGQVNKSNFKKYNVTGVELLNSCTNLQVSQDILKKCYASSPNKSVRQALSCYYSGNFKYGFKVEKKIGSSYIDRIEANYTPLKYDVPSLYDNKKYSGGKKSNELIKSASQENENNEPFLQSTESTKDAFKF